jgi:Helix-turn-helix domain
VSTNSIFLPCAEADGEDEAKERTSARFTLLKLMLADRTLTFSEFKVCVDLLMIRYNVHTGQCNPGVGRIAEDCAIDLRTAKRALVKLRDVSQYLVFQSTQGGYKTDTTNDYEFRSPPVAPRPPLTSTPKSTSGGPGKTSGAATTGTSGGHVPRPVVPAPPKHEENSNLNMKSNSNVPLPSVADTLDSSKGSGSEKGKEESKRTSEEASKKPRDERNRFVSTKPQEARNETNGSHATVHTPPIVLPDPHIENGVVWMPVSDHETRCRVLDDHYDKILSHLQLQFPDEKIKTLRVYVPRNGVRTAAQ